MKQEYKQPIGKTTECKPKVPKETTADTSELKETLEIILGDASATTSSGRKRSLKTRAKAFRKQLDSMDFEKEVSKE